MEKNKCALILGTVYRIKFADDKEEPRLKKNWGFCDFHKKEIYITI